MTDDCNGYKETATKEKDCMSKVQEQGGDGKTDLRPFAFAPELELLYCIVRGVEGTYGPIDVQLGLGLGKARVNN